MKKINQNATPSHVKLIKLKVFRKLSLELGVFYYLLYIVELGSLIAPAKYIIVQETFITEDGVKAWLFLKALFRIMTWSFGIS